MRRILFLAVLATLPLGGCGKKPAASPHTSASPPIGGRVEPLLTEQICIFIRQKVRLPIHFVDLAGSVGIRPRKPAEMKWAIDSATCDVRLVKK